MNLLGSTAFPQMQISDALGSSELEFGPSVSFGNAGMYQNQAELGSAINWVKGRHTIAIGGSWDHTQLNIINKDTSTGLDNLGFSSFTNFVEGNVRTGRYSSEFAGNSNRYYRSDTAGAYINDNYKVLSNLSLTVGLRWDFDGPLSEKYGRLTDFDPACILTTHRPIRSPAADWRLPATTRSSPRQALAIHS
jgi:outer membrane receptor protein involved in Fe transport